MDAVIVNHRAFANAPGAIVYTNTPRTVTHLFRQRVRWTYGFLRNIFDYRFMLMNPAYGDPGLVVLPIALVSVLAGVFFFLRLVRNEVVTFGNTLTRFEVTHTLPHLSLHVFYMDTSMMVLIVYISMPLVVVLISAGSLIGTGSYRVPFSTPLFVCVYCFIAPTWLGTAIIRALFKTGVQW